MYCIKKTKSEIIIFYILVKKFAQASSEEYKDNFVLGYFFTTISDAMYVTW